MSYCENSFKVKDYVLTTGASKPVIELEEVKEFLKIDDNYQDSFLLSLIATVTLKAEQITGRDLLNKTYKGLLDHFPNGCYPPYYYNNSSIQIQKSKLQSVTSIQYFKEGVLTTFDPAKYYITNKQEYASICLVDGESWASDVDRRKQAVEITFIAGYGNSACNIPSDLKQAMLAHINLFFENRGDCGDEKSLNDLILGLYMPYIVSKKFFCVI
jgi:uncharacterized phiE125 gp8 family phage protein